MGEARARSLVEWGRPGRGHWWNEEARARSLVEWGWPGRGQHYEVMSCDVGLKLNLILQLNAGCLKNCNKIRVLILLTKLTS